MKITGITLFFVTIFFTFSCSKGGPGPEEADSGTFTDPRDQKTYTWKRIGSQVWMTQNLAYKPSSGNYWIYNNDEAFLADFGYLYDWATAQNVAPAGWHLPTEAELRTLVNGLGGKNEAYAKLLESGTDHWWDPNIGTNSSGFTALPGGYYDDYYNDFKGMGQWTMFQCSETISGKPESGFALVLNHNFKEASVEGGSLKYGKSVRCIRD